MSKENGFQFRDDLSKTLDIAGHTFTVRPGDVEGLLAAQELKDRFEKVDLAALEAKAYRVMCDEIMAAIDQVLGEGSCAQILTGRRVNIIDLVDLLKYVLTETASDFSGSVDNMVAEFTTLVPED